MPRTPAALMEPAGESPVYHLNQQLAGIRRSQRAQENMAALSSHRGRFDSQRVDWTHYTL